MSAVPRLAPPGVGRGNTMGDVVAITEAEMQWARGAQATPVPAPARLVAYAPVYYPGTADVAAAAAVPVTAGQERTGVGLTLQIVPLATIGGSVIDAGGQPVSAGTVSLFPRRTEASSVVDRIVASGAMALPRTAISSAGFSIIGVPPGEYTLVARSGFEPPDWSVTTLSVDGRDQADLVLRLVAGIKLSGSIVFERSTLTPPSFTSTGISLAASGSSIGGASTPRAYVDSNGTFEFSSIVPWTYTLKTMLPQSATDAGWMLKSAMLNGRDLADVVLEITPGSALKGLVITFTDRAAEISGRLVDAGGLPLAKYSIVVVTADRALWLPNARRIRSAQPANDGSFTITGLPPGDYAIAAAEDISPEDLADPSFLTRLVASAHKLTLAEGEKKKQDLQVR